MAATELDVSLVEPGAAPERSWPRYWPYWRARITPVLIWLLLAGTVVSPLMGWLNSEERYDKAALREWLEESRFPDKTLAQLVAEYQNYTRQYLVAKEELDALPEPPPGDLGAPDREEGLPLKIKDARNGAFLKREEIFQHLSALGDPATKMYPMQLLLFPMIYRLEVRFDFSDVPNRSALKLKDGPQLDMAVFWDSGQQLNSGRYPSETFPLGKGGHVQVVYQLRAWNKRQRDEQRKAHRLRLLSLLAVAATGLGLAWLLLLQADERERERQRRLAQEQIAHAERRHADAKRQLLEQRLATQAAERQALELKSHLYAGIGIMAGSYAHNIKNLLVRPNDLLRRCLETDGVPANQERMIREVQQTLGTVTERLQQILHTVRRDPSQTEQRILDLNVILRALGRTWADLAADRWQLDLTLELCEGPLWISGDVSHLQQAIENLLFNARDATFEMRNHQRDAARRSTTLDATARRQALIQAAAWRGKVVIHSRRSACAGGGEEATLEVSDNGAGMSEEVLLRCTETHFTTKRDNALYEGHSTGMGLGLSFVVAILEHHHGKLEIESEPMHGTTFRVKLQAATALE
jgi:signal transduction histidine kinase